MAGSDVVVVDGRVISVSPPRTRTCPLRARLYSIEEETEDSVRKTVESYITDWGMFTANRVIRSSVNPVRFGVSEILSAGLRQGILDAVVCVCEGAGTVISADPEVVQGIGAHMTGLVATSPESAIIDKLRDSGVEILSPQDARMDQVAGVRRALEMGYSKLGVTLAGPESSQALGIRDLCRGLVCAIASVHNTGMSRQNAYLVAESCDIVSSCASRWVRETVAKRALMQLGLRIPVLVLTRLGKELALARLREHQDPLIVGAGSIPVLGESQPDPLR